MALTTKISWDIDARRFVRAAGLNNFNRIRAVDYLVKGLKTSNIWSKCSAIYPMAGSTPTSNKFNLKNPIDSDLAYRLLYVASPTISFNGIDWNGTTQYANTNCNPSTDPIISLNSMHLSFYSRENTATSGADIGVTSGANGCLLNPRANYLVNGASKSFVNTDSSGFFIVSRTASNLTTQYRNGVSVDTTNTVSGAIPAFNIYIGARNATGSPLTFSDRQMAFASIGSALTSTEAFIFNQIVQQFQIILQRTL